MKLTQTIGIIIVLCILGGIAFNTSTTVETRTETVEVKVEVSTLDERIKSAKAAARTEVEALAQAAYDEAYNQAMLEIETNVTDEYIKEIDAANTEKKQELISY